MKLTNRPRIFIALAMMFCLFLSPLYVYAKKGEKNFNQGIKYENELKWDLAAQEFALALAQLPSDAEYRLHYQRAMFNASQMFMQQGRTLEEKGDYVGAYNAYRQAYAYDPVNELALAEMQRMVRMQSDKVNGKTGEEKKDDVKLVKTSQSLNAQTIPETAKPQKNNSQYGDTAAEQKRVINYNGDLKAFIKEYAKFLNLNVLFDSTTFRQGGGARTLDITLRDVTAAEALDYVFQQERLFFQKIGRRTIMVADQTQRPMYQQLVIRTYYLSNADPEKVRTLLQTIIPAQSGRIQTGVVVDKETNSITLRDTSENIRLLGELIKNIDKDRPEVVMDVNIYEVSKDRLLQLGNQIGDASSLINLGGAYPGVLSGDRSAFSKLLSTAAAGLGPSVGVFLPPSTLSALEKKNDAKLLVSTQVHAFNNEESTARIGQRVPVQTAQVYPFSNTTPTGGATGGAFGGSGFPVINFEPVGLTLKFKPIIYPNKDVQVTMSIESKDVFNANTFTPTFIERTITGTARIQNNRTMMLASVAQDRNSRGRTGLPLLGLIPILGRLFSTPTQDNTKTDIVIAVTPRVLRAPDITPRDLEEYPSGTMQNPTWNSIAKMIQEEDREEQLAQARNSAKNVDVQYNPDENQKQIQADNSAQVQPQRKVETPTQQPQEEAPSYFPASTQQSGNSVANSLTNSEPQNTMVSTSETSKPSKTVAVVPQPIDASKSVNDLQIKKTAEKFDNPNTPVVQAKSSVTEAIEKYASRKSKSSDVNMSLVVDSLSMQGNKRRVAMVIDAGTPINNASITMRYDTKKIAINGVTAGDIFAKAKGEPEITPLATPDGKLMLKITMPTGASIKGTGVLVFLEIEMLQEGTSPIMFDYNNVRLLDIKDRPTFVEVLQDVVVK
jgi:general secretion pathway protein D